MKLRSKYDWRPNKRSWSISGAIEGELLHLASGGVAEVAQEQAKNTGLLLSQLVEMLHSKGVLSDADVLSLLPGYERAE